MMSKLMTMKLRQASRDQQWRSNQREVDKKSLEKNMVDDESRRSLGIKKEDRS
jgi:hypothetical protein